MIISKSLLKSKMLEFFRNVESTGEEIIVTDNGKPVLKVVPIWDSKSWAEVFPEGAGKILCTKEELIKAEQFYLDSYKTFFNTCKEAGSLSRLGIAHREETKRKIAMNNKSKTPQVRIKLSLARKGKPKSEEWKKKMSLIPRTEEWKKNIGDSKRGKIRRSPRPECRENMSRCHKIPILQFDKQMNFIKEWDGAKDARDILFPNIKNSGITHCLRGRKKSYGGFIWKYKKTYYENNSFTKTCA